MAMNFPYGNRSQAFAATSAFPLDARTYFESYDAALAAAAKAKPVGDSSTSYYFGQHVAVVEMIENVPQNAKLYIIAPVEDEEGNLVGTLQEVGSATDGDGQSIELVDGVLSVKNFGKRFYKYIPATETEAAKYELVEVSTENPWKSGLQPRVDADGSIGWYEPNPTTIEGVQDQVTGIQGDVEQAQKDIDAVEENLGKAEEKIDSINNTLYGTEGEEAVEGLVDKVTNLEGEVVDLWDAVEDTYSKEEVDGLVSGVFHYKGIHEGTYEDLPSLTAKTGDVWQIGDKEYAWNGEIWVELGFTIDLSTYATKQYVDDEVKKVQDAVDAHEESVAAAIEEINNNHASLVETVNGHADDIAENAEEIVGAKASIEEHQEALDNLSGDMQDLSDEFKALSQQVGNAEVTDETGNVTSEATGIYREMQFIEDKLEEITSVGGEPNIIERVFAGSMELTPASKVVTIPVYSLESHISGLVPVANTEVATEEQSHYFLSMDGNWAIPRDMRIGNLNGFSTVEDYVDDAIATALEWSSIAE